MPTVTDVHVSRTKTCWTPFETGPRLVAEDAKAMKRPSWEMTGSKLAESAGVAPSGVDPRNVKGVVQPLLVIWQTC